MCEGSMVLALCFCVHLKRLKKIWKCVSEVGISVIIGTPLLLCPAIYLRCAVLGSTGVKYRFLRLFVVS